MSELFNSRSSSIRQSFKSRAVQKSVYRFLNNASVAEAELIESCVDCSRKLCAGRHLLVLNDTTEANVQRHAGRLQSDSGIGLVGNNTDAGFFAHLGLAYDIEMEQVIGFSSINLWHRPVDKADKIERNYGQLPVEQKESHKWIQCAKESSEALKDAASVTIVGDRESDMYELFCDAEALNLQLVVRSRMNRKTTEGTLLYDQIAGESVQGIHTIKVIGDKRKQSVSRTANLSIRYKKISLVKPKRKRDERPETVSIWLVEAKEEGKANGICWRILTTHSIENFNDAIQVIEWYRCRWYIEEVFRLLKNKGYKIEDSQVESGWALRKLCVLLLHNILRVMQMLLAYESKEEQDAKLTFQEDEIDCLGKLQKEVDGKTEKLKNKHPPGTLKWATWIIARLGGWSGYTSQRPPGPITLKNGLDRFNDIFKGYMMMKLVGTQ